MQFESIIEELSNKNPHLYYFHKEEIVSRNSLKDIGKLFENCCIETSNTIYQQTGKRYKTSLVTVNPCKLSDISTSWEMFSYSYKTGCLGEELLVLFDKLFINKYILEKSNVEEIRTFDKKLILSPLVVPVFNKLITVLENNKIISEDNVDYDFILPTTPIFDETGVVVSFALEDSEDPDNSGSLDLFLPKDILRKMFDNGLLNKENELYYKVCKEIKGNSFVSAGECEIFDGEQLKEGEVIPLNKKAGECFDLIKDGKKIATGELVVIDENLGIRINEVLIK